MFVHWLNAFPRQKATTLAVEKFLLKIIISTWPFPMNYMVIVELTLEDKYLKLFEDVFYCTEFLLFLQSSVLWIDGWMNKGYYKKNQLYKLPKALSFLTRHIPTYSFEPEVYLFWKHW